MALNMNTIILKNYLKVEEEYAAVNVITPGMILELTSADKVQRHSVAGGNVWTMVALEDENQGKTIKDTYAVGEKVRVWIPQRGDQGLMLLEDGQNVVIGDALESNGIGKLRKHTIEATASNDAQQVNIIYSKPVVALALEAQDLSALDGSNSSLADNSQYIKVRFI